MKNEKILVPVEYAKDPAHFVAKLMQERFAEILPSVPQTESHFQACLEKYGCQEISIFSGSKDYWLASCHVPIEPTEENSLWAPLVCDVSMLFRRKSRGKFNIRPCLCLDGWEFLWNKERSEDNV